MEEPYRRGAPSARAAAPHDPRAEVRSGLISVVILVVAVLAAWWILAGKV